MKTLDMLEVRGRSNRMYAGYDRGAACRVYFELDLEDADPNPVCVLIPPDTFSVNTTFFSGMFTPSIRTLGAEGFRAKYVFKGYEQGIEELLDTALNAALRRTSPLAP